MKKTKEDLYIEVGYGLSSTNLYSKEEITESIVDKSILIDALINNVNNAAITLDADSKDIRIEYAVQVFVNKADVYQNKDEEGVSFYICKDKSDVIENIVSLRAVRISSNNHSVDFNVDSQSGRNTIVCDYDSLVSVFGNISSTSIPSKFKKIKNVVTYGDPYMICHENVQSFTRTRK